MNKCFFIASSLMLAFLCFGCKEPVDVVQDVGQTNLQEIPKPNLQEIPFARPFPAKLPVFREYSTNSIRVIVWGLRSAVERPGIYYFTKEATISDVVKAARVTLERVDPRYSGIERTKSYPSVLWFTRDRNNDMLIPLQDGDIIYFGHEQY